jgi:hypothetical protein
MRWVWVGAWIPFACAVHERERAGPQSVPDPYGGGEGADESPMGTEPTLPAPEADKLELGAELDGRSAVLIERAHTAACSTNPAREGYPNLDVVMESLASSSEALQTCYMDARSRHKPDDAGITVDVQATFGENGCLERAIIADENALTPQFTMCAANVAKGWTIPAYRSRSQHRFSVELAP